jgi:hypothetical protein
MNDLQCQMILNNLDRRVYAYVRRTILLEISDTLRDRADATWWPWMRLAYRSVANFIEEEALATPEANA